MAFISTIEPDDADGLLRGLFARYADRQGRIDNILLAHSVNPEVLAAHMTLYTTIMKSPGVLPRSERELAGVIVSMINGCAYCTLHHARSLAALLADDRPGVVKSLLNHDLGCLTDREQAIVSFVELLTTRPTEVDREDIDTLKAHGLCDLAVHDLVQVVGYFAYANRVVLGLGVEVEDAE